MMLIKISLSEYMVCLLMPTPLSNFYYCYYEIFRTCEQMNLIYNKHLS